MWRDPMDELIADLEQIAPPEPSEFNDQMPSFTDMTYWSARSLRRLDSEWDGHDPDEVDPTFEEEFAEFRARWPKFYTQGPLERG